MTTGQNSLESRNILLRLEWSIRALAQSATVQIASFPAFVCAADELALDFEEALRPLAAELEHFFTPHQAQLIVALDKKLAAISGTENAQWWTNDALTLASEWEQIRKIAIAIVTSVGWSADAPPVDRATYVGPDA